MDPREESLRLRVPKETVRALVRTPDLLIVGELHARPEKRLKDELNLTSERYVAVTDAKVYDASGSRLLYAASFLLVSNEHVVTVAPVDGVNAPPDAL